MSTPARPGRRTFGRVTLLGLAAGALTAVATARPAVQVPEQEGALVRPPSAELPLPGALALVVLAAWGAMLVLRGTVRRAVLVLGLVAALGTAVALGAGLPGLVDRVREPYLAAGVAEPDVSVTGWYAAAWVGALLSVAALAAAVALVPTWPEMGTRYDAPAGEGATTGDGPPTGAAAATVAGAGAGDGAGVGAGDGAGGGAVQGAVDGDVQRALWRALDEGRDPTGDAGGTAP